MAEKKEKEKKLKPDWFTKKYGAYNTDIPDWYSSKIGFRKKDEMPDWHTEKYGKKERKQDSDWFLEKHGSYKQKSSDWHADKYGFRTDFPEWSSGMNPGNLDRIAEMYEKRFGRRGKAKTRDAEEDQTTRKAPL